MNARQAFKILLGDEQWELKYKVSTIKNAKKAMKIRSYADYRKYILPKLIGKPWKGCLL